MKNSFSILSVGQIAIALMSASLITACSGGGHGGGGSPALTQAQHDALAQAFITEATAEGLGYQMVKQDTGETGYIVVKMPDGSFSAFDVDDWKQGTSVKSFAADYRYLTPTGNNNYNYYVSDGYDDTEFVSSGYWTTDSLGNNEWVDTSGWVDYGWVDTSYNMTFEVVQPSTKDLQKIAAFKQAYELNASAQKVQQKYGLSLERATQVAKLAIQVKNTPKMSSDDYDSLSQQLLGVPVAKLDNAMAKVANGDTSASNDVDDIINQAAKTNGVGPEQARALLNTLSGATGPSSTTTASK